MVMLPKDAVKKKWSAGHRDDFSCCRVCDRIAAWCSAFDSVLQQFNNNLLYVVLLTEQMCLLLRYVKFFRLSMII